MSVSAGSAPGPRSAVAAALLVAALTAALPATAGSAELATPWPGWTAQGPTGAGSSYDVYGGGRVAAGGPTTAVFHGTRFTAAGPGGAGRVVGVVPVSSPTGVAGRPAVLPSGRLLVLTLDRAARSDDRGRTWSQAELPATGPSFSGARTGPVFADDRRGIVVVDTPLVAYGSAAPPPTARTGPSVLATDDGGETWTVRRAPEAAPGATRAATPRTSDPGPPPPASRVTVRWLVATGADRYLRAVDEPSATYRTPVLERSDDAGATWTRVPLPGVPAPEQVGTPGLQAAPPQIGPAGTTASGAVVVPVGDALLVSDDDLRTFRRVVPPGRGPRVLCDPAGACLVDVQDPDRVGRRLAVPFDGTTFGPPRPALPADPVSPAAGVVLGTRTDSALAGPLQPVRSTDGGLTYADEDDPGRTAWIAGGDGRITARRAGDLLQLTRDGVGWDAVPMPPSPAGIVRIVSAPGGVVVLTTDDRVWRRRAGTWSSWDASAVKPIALAATGSSVLVVGERGILRRTGSGTTQTLTIRDRTVRGLPGRALSTVDGLTGVSASGRTALAWFGDDDRYGGERGTDGGLLRSTDAGRTWRPVRGLPYTDDLQLVTPTLAYRTFGSGLYVSRDGGARWTIRQRIAGFGRFDAAGLAFRDARSGVVGGSVTTDGGRTLTPVPLTPGSERVLRLAGDGVLQAGPFSTPLRLRSLASAVRPIVTLRAEGRPRADDRRHRLLRVSGRVRGLPAGTAVAVVGAATRTGVRGARNVDGVPLTTDASGRFRGRVRILVGGDRLLRARTDGSVDVRRTVLGASSPWIAVPR